MVFIARCGCRSSLTPEYMRSYRYIYYTNNEQSTKCNLQCIEILMCMISPLICMPSKDERESSLWCVARKIWSSVTSVFLLTHKRSCERVSLPVLHAAQLGSLKNTETWFIRDSTFFSGFFSEMSFTNFEKNNYNYNCFASTDLPCGSNLYRCF